MLSLKVRDDKFFTSTGTKTDSSIVLDNVGEGVAFYGGYLSLGEGVYQADIELTSGVRRTGRCSLTVTAECGQVVLANKIFQPSDDGDDADSLSIGFCVLDTMDNIEVVIHDCLDFSAEIEGVAFTRSRELADIFDPNGAQKKYNILYISAHEILEYDELRTFTDMGHRVYSIGFFSDPFRQRGIRHGLPQFYWLDAHRAFTKSGLTAEFLAMFDFAIVVHYHDKVREIAELDDRIPIVYRSIGQSVDFSERELLPFRDRIKVVRYAHAEANLPDFLPADATIYFAKYLADFYEGWRGDSGRILTFHTSYQDRSDISVPQLPVYQTLSALYPMDLYGVQNENVPGSKGPVSAARQLELYRSCAFYFYVYSSPPSYTLSFMEAMATGTPILAPSARFVMGSAGPGRSMSAERYEIADLLGNEPRLLYDTIEEARDKISWLLANPTFLRDTSFAMKAKFAKVFDVERVKPQWQALFDSL